MSLWLEKENDGTMSKWIVGKGLIKCKYCGQVFDYYYQRDGHEIGHGGQGAGCTRAFWNTIYDG